MLQVYLAVSVITPACLAGAYIEEGGIVVDWKRTIMFHLDLVLLLLLLLISKAH